MDSRPGLNAAAPKGRIEKNLVADMFLVRSIGACYRCPWRYVVIGRGDE